MFEEFFYYHKVFRYDEIVNWLSQKKKLNRKTLNSNLNYFVKKGKLHSLRKGLYLVLAPDDNINTLLVDPYIIAAKLSNDSVLCYHTALELHGLSYSIFNQYTYYSTQKIRPFSFQIYDFNSIQAIGHLINQEINIIDRQGIKIKVTSLERTYVDIIDRIELSGGLEEVFRAIENMVVLDIDKVVNYCLLHNNATLVSKVGYFLETTRTGGLAVAEKLLQKLEKRKSTSLIYLTNKRKNCKLIKRWNLMVPNELLNKEWEEQDYDI